MSHDRLRIYIVDDESPARKKMIRLLAPDANVELAGESGDGADALLGIPASKPDLLLLDIQMPGMNGFELVEALGGDLPSQIVFVTAHDEFAIRAFEVHAFGYLLKPFDQKSFTKVIDDAKAHFQKKGREIALPSIEALLSTYRQSTPATPKLLIEQNGRGFFLSLEDIDWAETERNYVLLHVGERTHTVRGTLDNLQERLDPSKFLRLNRSCMVRFDAIKELQKWSHGEYRVVFISGETRTWTRRYLNQNESFFQRLS